MTLVAGRIQSLHSLERSPYGEDANMQGILKSGPMRKPIHAEVKPYVNKPAQPNQRHEDSKRLVRFCEAQEKEDEDWRGRVLTEVDSQNVIMFGSNMYYVNNSNPNSAVRKLFPNSKLTPINPSVNRTNLKDSNQSHSQGNKHFENTHNMPNRIKSKSDNEDAGGRNITKRKIDNNALRRNLLKVPPETKLKPGKCNEPTTPLIERIKLLTCNNEDVSEDKSGEKGQNKFNSFLVSNYNCPESTKPITTQEENSYNQFQENVKDLPKQAKEGLNLMRYNQAISHTRSQADTENKPASPSRANMTDEARRSFLSSLSQNGEGQPGDRSSVATSSTTGDTVYSLSDIEEVLTEEEKEIKEAFFRENKQDELELFVQQDAGRTERLRKRYSLTPKPEKPVPVRFSNGSYPFKSSNFNGSLVTNGLCIKKDKPKFGSTIEILQQLQQQIETPYQLEGRRTACSNYSDSSIPLSERLYCDESLDGYEPVIPKLNVYRTCSLDSKNYEEIDNFHSAVSVPRTKSHEHPCLAYLELDPYFYSPSTYTSTKYSGNYIGKSQPLEQSIYASSPDLHGCPHARLSSYNHAASARQLHPMLQKQYCRYPVPEAPPRPAEEGKVLTPPNRMHTYMNVPTNAPCYLSPPPYSKVNHCLSPNYDTPHIHTNIYQNIPLQNPHMMTIRRLCTERERGVPEGATSGHESSEIYPSPPTDFFFSPNVTTIPKPSSLPHHYCVDV